MNNKELRVGFEKALSLLHSCNVICKMCSPESSMGAIGGAIDELFEQYGWKTNSEGTLCLSKQDG